jgi:hypothetical protein
MQNAETNVATALRLRGIPGTTDLEVSDLIETTDVVLGEAAAQRRTPTSQIGAKPLPNGSAIIASQPWPRTSYTAIAVACRLHLVASGTVNVTVSGTAIVIGKGRETETETETGIAITTAHLVLDGTTIPITTANGATERRSVSDFTVAALTEVRMTSSPMATIGFQDQGVVDLMTKMTTLGETPETPR